MKVLINGRWCDTKDDWGYKTDEEFIINIFNKKDKYEIFLKNFVKFCEDPNNRHRLSDKAMCEFLDMLRTDTLEILK